MCSDRNDVLIFAGESRMNFSYLAVAVVSVGLLSAAPMLARAQTDADKQPAQSYSHPDVTKQGTQSLAHADATKQKTQSLSHSGATKQPTQSYSHSDNGLPDGVTKQQ